MEFIAVGSLLIGVAAGFWGYRYLLKRNPDLLAKLARETKAAGQKLKDRY